MPVYQLFDSDWAMFGIFFVFILLVVACSDIIRRRYLVSGETTRQFVHVAVGLLVSSSPFLFKAALPPALLAIIFIVLNAVAIRQEQMKGMHTILRRSYGTVFFPLSFLILILFFWYRNPAILMVSMLIMTLADPLGAMVGNRPGKKINFRLWRDTKTVSGSLAIFASTFLLTTVGFYFFRQWAAMALPELPELLVIGLNVSIVATVSEAISHAGSDNLSLPLSTALMLAVLEQAGLSAQVSILGWILFSFLLAFVAYRLHALTLGGAAGAMLLGSFVFSIGGIYWVIPMATFFVLSSILSKIGKLRKSVLKGMVKKGSQRDILQVYANGGISLLMAVLFFATRNELFYNMFLGSLAAATADTWGTEIGIFSKRQPRNIINFTPVSPGTSGGVTALGTTGGLIGAGVLTISGIPSIYQRGDLLQLIVIIAISGILGALFDSFLGASVQAQYKCPQCGRITEKREHCDEQDTQLISGVPWIDNDVVNFCCTSSGALLVLILTRLF